MSLLTGLPDEVLPFPHGETKRKKYTVSSERELLNIND
jgi:hypothetical protein